MSFAPDPIIISAQSRIASYGFRQAALGLVALGGFFVLGDAALVALWLVAITAAMRLDLAAARRVATGLTPENRRRRVGLFLGASFTCFALLLWLCVDAALHGGGAGQLFGLVVAASSVVNVTAQGYQCRLYRAISAGPPALAALVIPFLPHLSHPPETLAAQIGAFLGICFLGAHIIRTADRNARTFQRAEAATLDARERREEAESRRREAERASRAKSELLANMSHELRTPLNAVIGYSEILEEELRAMGANDCVQDAGRIRTAGVRLLHLIEDLLDLSKVDAGRMEVTVETFDPAALLKEVADARRADAESRGTKIALDLAGHLGQARTDKAKFRGAMEALLDNALAHCDDGTVTISARAEQDSGAQYLVAAISDTGVGIAKPRLAALFEPFGDSDSSATTRQGTGLSLAKHRRFMQLLGGDLAARSVLGQGSTFTIRMPAVLEPQTEENEAPPEAPTVLVIEDDPTARDLARRAAARAGLRAVCADNAADGLLRARRDNPDLIVLDIELPDRSGWEILSLLKRDSVSCRAPIVVVSVVSDPGRAAALGAAAHLVKPVGRDQLALAMRRHLEAATAGAAA